VPPPDLLPWRKQVLLLALRRRLLVKAQEAEADVRFLLLLKSHLAELPMLFHP
jgi:hypothetical protein